LDLYESAEVPEYWVIDPEQKLIEVYRLNGARQDGGRYEPRILRIGDTAQSTLFPGLAIA